MAAPINKKTPRKPVIDSFEVVAVIGTVQFGAGTIPATQAAMNLIAEHVGTMALPSGEYSFPAEGGQCNVSITTDHPPTADDDDGWRS